MNSPERDWWIVRSGEYVLGTLRGRELERFEKILEQDDELRAEVDAWEQRLQGLNETTIPRPPSASVWPAIQARVHAGESAKADATGDTHDRAASRRESPGGEAADVVPIGAPKRRSGLIWPAVAALATAASLVMGILLSQSVLEQSVGEFTQEGVSLVLDAEANPLWYVETDFDGAQIRVTALSPPPIDGDRDYQLWQVRPDDAGVDALGLLPEGQGLTREFDVDSLRSDLVAFAVSLEPEGGSPEAVPTGPVLYQGGLVHTRADD